MSVLDNTENGHKPNKLKRNKMKKYDHIPQDEQFIIEGLFKVLQNDLGHGIANMLNALDKKTGTFGVMMVAFKRRLFRDNSTMEALYQKYVDLMEDKGYIVPLLQEIKAAKSHGSKIRDNEYFNHYLAQIENGLDLAYQEMALRALKVGDVDTGSTTRASGTRTRATEKEKEEAMKKVDENLGTSVKELHKSAINMLTNIFQNDVKTGLRTINNGLKKGEDAFQILERCIKRGTHSEEVQKVKEFLEKSYDDATGLVKDVFEDAKDKAATNTIVTSSDIGFAMSDLPGDLGTFWQPKDINIKDEDEQDNDETDAPGVPFISQNILMFDKEVIRDMLNDRMLEIANLVAESGYDHFEDWTDYDKDVFNTYAEDLKKKERRYLKGRAEELRNTIALFDIRVENIGHKMLSHIVANF